MSQQTLTAVPMPLDALRNVTLCAHLRLWHAEAAIGAVQAYTLHHEGVNERGEALVNATIDRAGVAWGEEPSWYDAGTIEALLAQLV
ncbi:MAG: hypothetical protein AB7N91_27890 [Candidatus Tectimicrobiota bacterium]